MQLPHMHLGMYTHIYHKVFFNTMLLSTQPETANHSVHKHFPFSAQTMSRALLTIKDGGGFSVDLEEAGGIGECAKLAL